MRNEKYDFKKLLAETKKREERLAKRKFEDEQKRIKSKMFMVRG